MKYLLIILLLFYTTAAWGECSCECGGNEKLFVSLWQENGEHFLLDITAPTFIPSLTLIPCKDVWEAKDFDTLDKAIEFIKSLDIEVAKSAKVINLGYYVEDNSIFVDLVAKWQVLYLEEVCE